MYVLSAYSLLNRRVISKRTVLRFFCCKIVDQLEKKGLIVGVFEGKNDDYILTPAAQKFNETSGGKLLNLIDQCKGEINKGQCKIFNNIAKDFWSIAVVGLGPEKQSYNELEDLDEDLESVRAAAGIGAQKLQKEGVARILVEGFCHAEQAAEGSALALWRYQDNKSQGNCSVMPTIELYEDPDCDGWQKGLLKAESQNLARRLSDIPANLMTPLHFAQEAVNELCPCGVKVEVHDKDWIESKKMNAFMEVARGSCEPPVFLDIKYSGGRPGQQPILFVGKGVTFDSGGLCLKKCDGMGKHRADMSGAACIVAAIKAASSFGIPININAVIPLCEHMPSGMAMKCGDIVMGLNGKSIRIDDTDNEGRLIMADALVYGQNVHKPCIIIDVASLTPGIRRALGSAASGVFCNSETLWSQVRKAGTITGDRVWRMPIWKHYTKKVTSYGCHDVNNQGKGHGDPCLAAAFLNEFITCVDWIHFDTAGVSLGCEDKIYPYLTKGRMTGRPTRTLIQLLCQLAT